MNGGFAEGSQHNPWGIVNEYLLVHLEATRLNYNRGGIRITGGYRCPEGNDLVNGVPNSLHMRGRAADLKSADHDWTEAEFALLKEAATALDPEDNGNWGDYPSDHHYHVAW
jgi:uncharacterized protein YcbK (DUF882 family)